MGCLSYAFCGFERLGILILLISNSDTLDWRGVESHWVAAAGGNGLVRHVYAYNDMILMDFPIWILE